LVIIVFSGSESRHDSSDEVSESHLAEGAGVEPRKRQRTDDEPRQTNPRRHATKKTTDGADRAAGGAGGSTVAGTADKKPNTKMVVARKGKGAQTGPVDIEGE
jgi:hypothetical protein